MAVEGKVATGLVLDQGRDDLARETEAGEVAVTMISAAPEIESGPDDFDLQAMTTRLSFLAV